MVFTHQTKSERESDVALSLLSSYCGMYIPLSDDKHRKVRDSSKKHTKILDKFSMRIFFQWNFFFFGLNFVLDYIPQLYFVCNLLIISMHLPPVTNAEAMLLFNWVLYPFEQKAEKTSLSRSLGIGVARPLLVWKHFFPKRKIQN